MKKRLYILRPGLVALLLLLMAMAPAMAQTVVYKGDTTPLSVVAVDGDNYAWELYDNGTVNFATVPGNCPPASADFVGGNIGASVNVQWLKAGTYFFKVTATNITGCTSNIEVGILEVKESLPTANIAPPAPICNGKAASLVMDFTGTGPWNFTYTDGTTDWTGSASATPYILIIDPGPAMTTDYWIKSLTDKNGTNTTISNKVTQQVNPLPAPSTIYHN